MSLVAADRDSLQVRVGGGSRVQDPDVTIQGWEEEKRKRRCLSVCRLLPTVTPKLRPHFTPQNNFYRWFNLMLFSVLPGQNGRWFSFLDQWPM